MKCRKCGAEYEGDFCMHCGTKTIKKGNLLGFRSNKIWKKVLSISYLIIIGFYILGSITSYDSANDVITAVQGFLFMVAPYVFLSNYRLRNVLPLFKKHRKGLSFLGMVCVYFGIAIICTAINPATYCDHDWVETKNIKETCIKDGRIEAHCGLCDSDKVNYINKTGHSFEVQEDTEEKRIKKCLVCGEEVIEKKKDNKENSKKENDDSKTTKDDDKETEKTSNSSEKENNKENSKKENDDSKTTKDDDKETEKTSNSSEKENNKTSSKDSKKEKEKFFTSDDEQTDTDSIKQDFGIKTTDQLRKLGFNVEEATSIYNIFVKIGVNEISDVQKGMGTGIDELQSFVAIANNDKQLKFYFTVENRQLYYAGFRDATLYDSTKGGVLKNIGDVHIPKTEVDSATYAQLQILSQDIVKQYLNYPKTAKFPWLSGWGVGRSDDNYQITGKVTAKNGFGVESEMSFSVYFLQTNGKFKVEAVVIDDYRVK